MCDTIILVLIFIALMIFWYPNMIILNAALNALVNKLNKYRGLNKYKGLEWILEEKKREEKEWEEAVLAAAKRAGAVSIHQIVEMLRHIRVPKNQLDELCSELDSKYPSLFWTKVVGK